MDELFHSVPCLLCGENGARVLFRGSGSSAVVRCRKDGLLYLSPRPPVARLREVHARFVRDDNLQLFDGYRRAMLQREANVIKRTKKGGNLLDVGCATGTFFEPFRDAGWCLFGVDTSKCGVEKARKEFGAQVFCGTLAEARFPSRFFDVVTLLDTIYYLPDPAAQLREIHRILKEDGILAVEIPGLAYTLGREQGPLCWLLDRKWRRGLSNSYHLYFFSPQTMRALLAMTGFTLRQMVPEQASFRGGLIERVLNEFHFALARFLFSVSAHRISIAAKEFYLAAKTSSFDPGSLPSS